MALGLATTAITLHATIANHPPRISWIKDQRVQNGSKFASQHFAISDSENTLTASNLTVVSYNTAFTNSIGIQVGACQAYDTDGCRPGLYYIKFPNTPPSDGSATIEIKVHDNGGANQLDASTSFTLRTDGSSVVNPPIIGGIASDQVQVSSITGYGPLQFVIDDLDASGVEDLTGESGESTVELTRECSDESIIPLDNIQLSDINARTRTVKVLPRLGHPGRAIITITATDSHGNGFSTSTSFVVDVVDDSTNSEAPAFSIYGLGLDGSYKEQVTSDTYSDYKFQLADHDESDLSQLLVTAISSNTSLVPNDSGHLSVISLNSAGAGTLRIIPVQIAAGSPPQSSTITLSVTDQSYTRRKQFLYILKDPSAPAASFIRPGGIYNLDPTTDTEHRADATFLTGEMHRISWAEIDNGNPDPHTWNWSSIDDLLGSPSNHTHKLPDGQKLSLFLKEEPSYIAGTTGVVTWCETAGATCNTVCAPADRRPVPWDHYLQTQRNLFLQALADHHVYSPTFGEIRLADDPRLEIIAPNLPGADTGIQDPNLPGGGVQLSDMCGYSRAALLAAVQTELRNVQLYFPGKLIQLGFYKVNDSNGGYGSDNLWEWLYRDAGKYSQDVDPNGVKLVPLADEFNGIKAPRIAFFQEDLAATRPSAAPDYLPATSGSDGAPYTFTPAVDQLPTFSYYCNGSSCGFTDDTYNNGIVFQANTPWSSPVDPNNDGGKVLRTLNGSPNDGLEGAFNEYLSQYLELYDADIEHAQPNYLPAAWDHQRWHDGLQSWKDYTDHLRTDTALDAPAGLTVVRNASNSNLVSWYPVYATGAMSTDKVSYTLQRRLLAPTASSWATVNSCDPTSTTCTDIASTGTAYAYRVTASHGTNLASPPSQVAVFLSESNYDGYVTKITVNNQTTYQPISMNTNQPGIRAGEGPGSPVPHGKGFLSFNTGLLSSATEVLGARLRLKQFTPGTNFFRRCRVDIKKGSFNNLALQGIDYTSSDQTTTDAFPVLNATPNNWFTAELTQPMAFANVSNTDHTQFRIYFDEAQTQNVQEGWYSGESIGNEPQLIVQYK